MDQEADRWVAYLNDILLVDREMVTAHMQVYVDCIPVLQERTSVQVQRVGGGRPRANFIGLLNGFLLQDPQSKAKISYEINPASGQVARFVVVK